MASVSRRGQEYGGNKATAFVSAIFYPAVQKPTTGRWRRCGPDSGRRAARGRPREAIAVRLPGGPREPARRAEAGAVVVRFNLGAMLSRFRGSERGGWEP